LLQQLVSYGLLYIPATFAMSSLLKVNTAKIQSAFVGFAVLSINNMWWQLVGVI
jgi:hypothetical protein